MAVKRFLLISAGILVAILVAGSLMLPRVLDVERHRPAIERAIASATGRTVALGPLKARLFPLPELTAQGLTIGEDPRFGLEPFLEAQRVEIRVRFWPLLERRVSVASLIIDRPHLRLRRDRGGRWSVLSLGSVGAPAQTGGAAEPASGLSFSADRIRLSGGSLSLVDEAFTQGKTLTVEARDLECALTDLSLTSPVGLDVSFELTGFGRTELAGRVGPLSRDGRGTLPLDLTLGLAGSKASLRGQLTGLNERPGVDAKFTTSKVALQEILPVLRLVGPLVPAGLAPKGQIALDASVRGPLDDPYGMRIDGTATVAGLELGDASLRQPIGGISGSMTLRGDRAEITGFGATLGKSSVAGACTITRFGKPVIDVRLESPLLDVDDLLSLLITSPAAAQSIHLPSDPGVPTASVLRDVTIRGDLAVAKARVMNLTISNAKGKLALERGSARLSGVSADLYGGRMTGDLTTEVADAGPPFALSARLERVDFNALATDFSKDLAGLLYGTLETALQVRGRGLDTPALRRDLRGRGSLSLRDGKLTSVSILKTVAKGLEALGGRGIGETETPFRSLTGTFDIADGRAVTQDLVLDSPDLALQAKGKVGLDLSLDLNVAARFSPSASVDMVAKTATLKYLQDGQGRLALDLTAGGSLTAPSIGIDRRMIDRAAKSAAKEKLQEKGKSLLEQLLERKKEN